MAIQIEKQSNHPSNRCFRIQPREFFNKEGKSNHATDKELTNATKLKIKDSDFKGNQ